MPSPLLFELPALLLGLLFGSFLNVCISRLPEHRSVLAGRSHCPHCGHVIRWYDNIPLVSWTVLRAKCRDCGGAISWRYPVVEVATGLWFFEAGWRLWRAWYFQGFITTRATPEGTATGSIHALALAVLGFLLIGLLVMDWQTRRLPDAFTLSGILLGFVFVCMQAVFLPTGVGDIKFDPQHSVRLSSPGSFVAKGNVFMTGPEHLVLGRLLAIVAAGGLLLLVRAVYRAVRQREGVGFGDAKLLAMIAAFLGFWPAMLALFVGVIAAATYAMILLARRRAGATTKLPLGTFLAAGGLLAALAGTPLLAWYSSML